MEKIIKTAIANGSLKPLVTAIKAADSAETLSRPGHSRSLRRTRRHPRDWYRPYFVNREVHPKL